MCGIAGLAALRPVARAALQRMTALQAHRGPDGENYWVDASGCVAFGHRRLSIIDLSPTGAQPMSDASGRFVICYNGEIYNYVELASRLRAQGASFRSQSDTEVILEAYRLWGDEALRELNGMFAFALYDRERRRLICARDRFGEKPFLFALTGDYFAFASEYKALLSLKEIDDVPDTAAVLRFLGSGSAGIDDRSQTVFRGIQQLLPGEMLSLDLDTMTARTDRYWTLEPKPTAAVPRFNDAAREFRELLQDSVRLRLRSDVPVGSCLSGGLDSSSIVMLARQIVGSEVPYHVFTGRFPGTPADEGPYADAVTHAAGATPHLAFPTAEGLLADLPQFMWHNELPVGSGSQYAQWSVFKSAREAGVTVLLDGQGGDELLGGYEQYFEAYCRERTGAAEARGERAGIRARYPKALPTPSMAFKRALPGAWRWRLAGWLKTGSDFSFGLEPEAAALLRRDMPAPRPGAFTGLKAQLFEESFHTTLPTLLRYGDRNSMAHSREVRLPFCDHRLAEFVFSLPAEFLMGDIQTKRILRAAMQGLLPETVSRRWNKHGFVPPHDLWFRGPLLDAFEALLADGDFLAWGVWNVAWWRQVVERARGGASGLGTVLWKPFIAEMWRRHFLQPLQQAEKVSLFAAAPVAARA